MRTWLLLVAGLSVTLAIVRASDAAPADTLVLERTGAARISATPGSVITVPFRVVNGIQTSVTARVTPGLPTGWQLISAADDVDLAAGATELQLLTFVVPRNAAPGHYRVALVANYGSRFELISADSVIVELGKHALLDAQFMAAPALVRSGTSFNVTFLLRNRGNTPIRASMQARADGGLTARPDFEQAVIEPDDIFHVTVRVIASRQTAREIHTRVRLSVTDHTKQVDVAATSSLIRVLPTADTEPSQSGGHFPLRLHARLNSSRDVLPAVELSGAGPIIGGRDLRLEVVARTATRQNGLTNERDQFYLRLSDPHFDARVGDHVVSLSPLTEIARSGFGGSLNGEVGPLVMGGYAVRDRRIDNRAAYGGRLGFKLGSFGVVTGNYSSSLGATERRVYSGRGLFVPARFARAEIELARNAHGPAANARLMSIGGSTRWATYDFRTMRNDAEYQGMNPGFSSDAATLRIRPFSPFELGGYYMRSDRTNGLLAYGGELELRRASASLGAFTLEAEERDWTARSGTATRTQSVRVRSSFKTSVFAMYPGLEAAKLLDRNTGAASTRLKYNLRARVKLGLHSISASVGAVASERPGEAWQANSLSAVLQPFDGTYVTFDIQADEYNQGARTRVISSSIEQRLPRDHRIAARTRLVSFNGMNLLDQSIVTLEYILPLNVRLPQAHTATVKGVVVDESARPIANALIRLDGRSVMTSRNGRFTFNGVAPEKHHLLVDLSGAGVGLTTATPNPQMLDLSAAGTRELRIGVVRGASVRGLVRASGAHVSDSARIASFRRAMIVEVSQGSDVQRRSVDAAGQFHFDGLRPGTWQLRVVNSLPTDFRLTEASLQNIQLESGAEKEILLELTRSERPMKLLEEKELPTRVAPESVK